MLREVSLPADISGHLFLSHMPGRYSPFPKDEAVITDANVDTVVCLAPLDEIRKKSPGYAKAIDTQRLKWRSRPFPIGDYGVPRGEDRAAFLTLVGDVANALREARTVLIHCGAGVGRTGMAAIGVLLALGQPLDPAIVAVQRAGSQPETKDQAALVQWVERELEVHVMAKFVTLEHLSGGDFVVNIDHVVRIEQAQEGSIVHLSDGSEVEVKEVFPEVLEKLGGKPQG